MIKLYYQILFRKLRRNIQQLHKNNNFDTSDIDKQAQKLAIKIFNYYQKKFHQFSSFTHELGYLVTEIYSVGGHTTCLVNQIKSLSPLYGTQYLYFTKVKTAKNKAPQILENLSSLCKINGIHSKTKNFVDDLISSYNAIIENCPKILFIYIHSNDIFSTCLIGLLKQTTPMKIVFFNHASHNINLGLSLSDLILTAFEASKKSIQSRTNLKQIRAVGIFSTDLKDTIYYSKEIKNELKNKLGITNQNLITISGGTSIKFFENNRSPHFELIKKLLEKEPTLIHISLIKFSEEQEKIINTLFADSEHLRKKLIIIDPTPKYDLYFQCATLAIDSFPMPSGLTQVDLMRMKVCTVAKINKKNSTYTFHKYFPENYPYLFEKVDDMEKGILYLLHNKQEREKMIEICYNHYITTHDNAIITKNYINMITDILQLT